MTLYTPIHTGFWKEGHLQGIALDKEAGCLYFSFTTILLKTDLRGTPIGSVTHLAGHLGCITFDPRRRKVYGSLELKHDAIGRGIIARTGWDPAEEDAFYLVSFDCDRIDRMEMDAETDGVMEAVWLRDVVDDYQGIDPVSGKKHRYGCSGIDGTGLGPVFGADPDSPEKLMVAYGIYSETNRTDNDHQVILQYDPDIFAVYGRPLIQSSPHHSGPEKAEARYYLYTGNTTYGIQNLEYDPASRLWFAAVYPGQKPQFLNPPLFLIDGTIPPQAALLTGRNGEEGMLLTLKTPGCNFPLGSTGIASVGDGTLLFSDPVERKEEKVFGSVLRRYQLDPADLTKFDEVSV